MYSHSPYLSFSVGQVHQFLITVRVCMGQEFLEKNTNVVIVEGEGKKRDVEV